MLPDARARLGKVQRSLGTAGLANSDEAREDDHAVPLGLTALAKLPSSSTTHSVVHGPNGYPLCNLWLPLRKLHLRRRPTAP